MTGSVTVAAQRSGSISPETSAARSSRAGRVQPRCAGPPRPAAAPSPPPRRRDRDRGRSRSRAFPGRAARRRAGCAIRWPPRSRRDRPRRPDPRTSRDARPGSGRRASISAKILPAAAPATLGPAAKAAAAASTAAFLAQPASSTPVTSVVIVTSSLAAAQRVGELAGEALVQRGQDDRRPVLEHGGGVRRAAEHRHRPRVAALGREGRGQGAQRRDQTLGDDHHADRLEMRPPWAASTPGSALAGTARQTMSWPSGCSSAARMTRMLSGSVHPGEVALVLARSSELRSPARGSGSRDRPRARRGRASRPGSCPRRPAPITATRRTGGSPPSHSHWSITHGQIRSVTAAASGLDGSCDDAGSAAGARPAAAPCGDGSAIRGGSPRCRAPPSGRPGTPVSRASRPTPRLGVPSAPGRTRVPSGKISTMSPAGEDRLGGIDHVGIAGPPVDGEGTQRVEDPRLPGTAEELLLGHVVHRPARHAGDHERIQEAAVVGGDDHRPALGDVLEPDPGHPEVDPEERLEGEPDKPVDDRVGAVLAGALVKAIVIHRTLAYPCERRPLQCRRA